MNRTVIIAIVASLVGVVGVASMLRARLASPPKAIEVRFLPSGALSRGFQSPEFESPLAKDVQLPSVLRGEIMAGTKKISFRIVPSDKGRATLVVDTNGNGDLGDDRPIDWASVPNGDLTLYDGAASIDIGKPAPVDVDISWIATKDPKQAAVSGAARYTFDFGYELAFNLDGKPFKSFILGDPGDGVMIPVDRNGDHRTDSWREQIAIGEPFNYTGTTYRFAMTPNGLDLLKESQPLPQMPLPPDIGIGKPAVPIQATTIDGKPIDFPASYKGKLVMLDFWATWCGPCIGEIPNVRAAYAEHRDHGFEVLGVTLDDEGVADKLKAFMQRSGMTWPQIYEGKGWKTKIGLDYDVSSLPYSLLIDGDSGKILATGEVKEDGTCDLRGPGLSTFIGEQLAAKRKRATG